MQATTRFVATGLLATLCSLAFAQEAVQDSTWMTPSTQSRAEVRAAYDAARHDGSLPRGEASHTVVPSASYTLTRTQVTAEAREAMRLGLIPVQEGGARAATPAEREQIRQAGLRAAEAGRQVAAN
jgi:IS5 family transposase